MKKASAAGISVQPALTAQQLSLASYLRPLPSRMASVPRRSRPAIWTPFSAKETLWAGHLQEPLTLKAGQHILLHILLDGKIEGGGISMFSR